LTFGQLLKPENITEGTFTEIAEFNTWFHKEAIEMEDTEYWFQVNVMGVKPDLRELDEPQSDVDIIHRIRELTQREKGLQPQLSSATARTGRLLLVDGIFYNNGLIEVPADEEIQYTIIRSRHKPKTAGHPGRAKALAMVSRCFTWPSVKRFVNCYVDRCDSCQRTETSTLRPLGTLEPLPIPVGPWTDIGYNMITNLPPSNCYNSILTVIDCY
jgi:hypothetical protein